MVQAIAVKWMYRPRWQRELAHCLITNAVLALLTYCGFALRVNLTTISFCDLLLVVAASLLFGFWQASLTTLLAVACLDYFFTQPLFEFNITDMQDWVALGAFEVTALVISRLSAKELRNAREAALYLAGMERLYELSRSSLFLDLHQPPGPQLAILIQRIFGVNAVALFDMNLGRQDRMGDWDAGEEDLARECYLRNDARDYPLTQTWERILQAGSRSVGALLVRGKLNPLVVDAMASLAAMAIDRHQSFENEDRAEAARKSEQLRAAVMDSLAHEFKTPLTAVQTASSGLLEFGALNASQADMVMLIDKEAARLTALCTRLLQTAKLEGEQMDLETEDVQVQALLAEVLASPSSDQGRNPYQVAMLDPALTVRVDRGLLTMILSQYIDNARKYSTPGTPIEFAARRSNTEVIFSVHNFGPTIRIEDRERIFERFYRAPDVKDIAPGTGIGLSVVRKAAEAHHGHVWVISDEGEGTTFYLSLPNGARREH
jgi:two-component system sensor histidine kinase KdpD